MQDSYEVLGGPWPGRLSILARPRGAEWLEQDVRNWQRLGIDVVVSLLTPDEVAEFELWHEEECCRSHGIEFISLVIPDRGVPRSWEEVLGQVVRLDGKMAEGKAVGIHCRQGIGRSGLLAACLLVSSGLSPAAAFERLTEARGCPVPETVEQCQWVEKFAPELANVSGRG